jgi:hypothetical protein
MFPLHRVGSETWDCLPMLVRKGRRKPLDGEGQLIYCSDEAGKGDCQCGLRFWSRISIPIPTSP